MKEEPIIKEAPTYKIPPATVKRVRKRLVQRQYRFPAELIERLEAAAVERDVSANFLVNRAIEKYLDGLKPVTE